MLAFGVIGYGLEYAKAPIAPFVVGLVLAPLAEQELRSGLMASGGDATALFERPIAVAFLSVALLALLWPMLRRLRSSIAT
jgi:putative tricarboxylic transport membrane protein